MKDETENVTREYKNSEYFVSTVSSYRVHGHWMSCEGLGLSEIQNPNTLRQKTISYNKIHVPRMSWVKEYKILPVNTRTSSQLLTSSRPMTSRAPWTQVFTKSNVSVSCSLGYSIFAFWWLVGMLLFSFLVISFNSVTLLRGVLPLLPALHFIRMLMLTENKTVTVLHPCVCVWRERVCVVCVHDLGRNLYLCLSIHTFQ